MSQPFGLGYPSKRRSIQLNYVAELLYQAGTGYPSPAPHAHDVRPTAAESTRGSILDGCP